MRTLRTILRSLVGPGAGHEISWHEGDHTLVKVVVDWLRDPHYLSSSDEDYARDLVQRLYAKAVQL